MKKLDKPRIIVASVFIPLIFIAIVVPRVLWSDSDTSMMVTDLLFGPLFMTLAIVGYRLPRPDTTPFNERALAGMMTYCTFFGLSALAQGISMVLNVSRDARFALSIGPLLFGAVAGIAVF